MKYGILINVFLFGVYFCFSQGQPSSVYFLDRLVELTRREDISSLDEVIKENGFQIQTLKSDYDEGTYHVIINIEAKKGLGKIRQKNTGIPVELTCEELLEINFDEFKDYNQISVKQNYRSSNPISFFSFKSWRRAKIGLT